MQAPWRQLSFGAQQGCPIPPHSLHVRMAPAPVQVVPDFEQKAP